MGKLNSFISALVSISMLMNPLAFAADSSPGPSGAEAPGSNVDVMDYAFDVERASRFFDKYGSIVPKQPDVWGESRLARYRQQFETEMAKDIDDFKTTMQAALGRSDQAYLTMALSLNAAAGGEAGGGPLQNLTGKLGNATTAIENMQKLVEAYKKLQELLNLRKKVQQQAAQKAKDAASDGQDNGAGNGGDDDGDGGDDNNAGGGADNDGGGDAGDGNGGDSDGDTTANGDDTGEDQPAPAGEEDDVASLVTAMDKLVQRTKFGDLIQGAQIGLDPSLYLDQKATYLRHLEEIRRINEGDDTADSAGYGLYLLRIPVSVNPGNQTKTGYGAEATFVVSRPPLTASQINKIMEDLVLSDVTEMLANPISKMLKTWWKIKEAASGTDSDVSQSAKEFALLAPAAPFGAFQQSYMSPGLPEIDILEGFSERLMETYKETDTEDKKAGKLKAEAGEAFKAIAETVGSHAPLDSFAARRSLFPLPPSQAQDVLGTWQLRTITESVAEKVGSEAEPAQIQAILRAEFEAACDHLQSLRLFEPQDQRVDELKHLDSPAQIAEKILAGRLDEVKLQRAEFIRALDKVTGIKSEYLNDLGQEKLHTYVPEAERPEPAPAKMAATKASAWFVYVCTGLFNHAMTVDIKSVVGSETFPAGTPNYYDGTMTKVELSVFNRYVDERWPLHVFALEPASEDQNVDDRFSERREMQLALAASFMMGNISARTMLNFARRFEMDMKTIALNRTVVAFAHGEKTFGWKFYPRVQTPQPGSNIEQLYRTMWG
ncbi:MAG: hypothetical protein HYZ00_05235, partial [Candidatus Hydrogenedentes bacterium]|nr:hypothetical protein [Candidatus Hydrogenedentota bacterium]